MSTSYNLYDDLETDICITEKANKLRFIIFNEPTQMQISSLSEEPEKMLARLLYGIQVCSYWMDVDELKKIVNEYLDKKVM